MCDLFSFQVKMFGKMWLKIHGILFRNTWKIILRYVLPLVCNCYTAGPKRFVFQKSQTLALSAVALRHDGSCLFRAFELFANKQVYIYVLWNILDNARNKFYISTHPCITLSLFRYLFCWETLAKYSCLILYTEIVNFSSISIFTILSLTKPTVALL
jgi:hypothetical protein